MHTDQKKRFQVFKGIENFMHGIKGLIKLDINALKTFLDGLKMDSEIRNTLREIKYSIICK